MLSHALQLLAVRRKETIEHPFLIVEPTIPELRCGMLDGGRRLMRSSGKPLARISRDLDVSEQTLRNRRKQEEIDQGERGA